MMRKAPFFISLLLILFTGSSLIRAQKPGWEMIPSTDSSIYVAADTLNNGAVSRQMVRLLRYRPLPEFVRIHRGYSIMEEANERFLEQDRTNIHPNRMIKRDRNDFGLPNVLFGKALDYGSHWRLVLPGLASVFPDWNSVDGLWTGFSVGLSYRFSPGVRLTYKPDVYYTWKSKHIFTHHYLYLHYAPRVAGLFLAGAGITSDYTNMPTAKNYYLSEHATGLLGNNPIHIFKKEFLVARNELFAGPVQLTLSGAYERRRMSGLTPGNEMLEHNSLAMEAEVMFHTTPRYLYSTAGGTKYVNPAGYPGPVLGVVYRQAFKPGKADDALPWSEYRRIELLMRGVFRFGEADLLNYQITGGKFLNRKYVGLPDERYFTKSLSANLNQMDFRFFTTPSNYNGGESWASLILSYHPKRLFIRTHGKSLFTPDEALHFNMITRFDSYAPYAETGYSVGLGSDFIRLGAFVGYDFEAKSWRPAMRLSIPFARLTMLITDRE